MATEDARYRQSSQYRLWSFAHTQLAQLRSESNTLATKAISNRLRSSRPPVDPLPEFLTPAEERSLVTWYTVELLRAADFLGSKLKYGLPPDRRATAAIFLRRFYITNSIMTYPPTELLKTCIFFGCKAEGLYLHMPTFEHALKTTKEEVLAAEYILCQGIRFSFDVRHPYRALEGAIMELRALGDFESDRIDRAHDKAMEVLMFSALVTDAYFHYTPSQIMLAALAMADESLVQRIMDDAFSDQDAGMMEKVRAVVLSCREMLQEEPPDRFHTDGFWATVSQLFKHLDVPSFMRLTHEVQEAVMTIRKPLNKKLRKCRDPDRVDLVALQKARREHAQQQAKSKTKPPVKDDAAVFGGKLGDEREFKRRKTTVNGDDVFGPTLG